MSGQDTRILVNSAHNIYEGDEFEIVEDGQSWLSGKTITAFFSERYTHRVSETAFTSRISGVDYSPHDCHTILINWVVPKARPYDPEQVGDLEDDL